ncbi:MAG: zeta toxin family protein [Chloroflexota bacterium]|nr:zeta toxin family protein [Chloroflexota bacterium]
MAADTPRVYAVSGTQGAGKTTVAAILARRFDRGVHISADTLQKMIVSGRVWPEADAVTRETPEVTGDAGMQLRLRLRNACILARSFYEHGFTAVIDDIIFGDRFVELLDEVGDLPLHVVMLVPDLATVRAHERERGTNLWPEWEWLTESIASSRPRLGLWLDNSGQTPENTVDEIIRRSDEARVAPAILSERMQ